MRTITPCITGLFLILLFMLCSPHQVRATEQYAKQTGQSCSACHLDPAGGGELTARGTSFSATLHTGTEAPSPGLFSRIFRLIAGYIHFFTAIFWFGTILYVHLVLKPSYAASGLPRGEVRVGIVSMAVMGITGAILTHYRVTSLDTLIHTRFGILLIIKVSLYLVMVSSAAVVVTVIGPRLKAKKSAPVLPPSVGDMTPEQLAACDGKEGRPACFAFEGKIYDATLSKLWKQGVHMGRHNAGGDLTEALTQAPHGADKMTGLKEVGVLIVEGPRKRELHEKVFYFMAYMNLIIVFCIVLILSLWRWG